MPRKITLLATILIIIFSAASAFAGTASDVPAERAVLNYTGWAAIKRQHFDPDAAEDDWIYMKTLTILDNGGVVKILDEGKETGYALELIVITYERTNTTVLKLGLIEDKSGKTITYIWGEPGAGRLGMNLRWMQTGLTLAGAADDTE